MTPVSKQWCLDSEEKIDIWRRGYPLVPNFSTTIDSATGQTLKAAIPDLGDEFSVASQYVAMRGYIAFSRVIGADGLLIAQPFNPLLFQCGPQTWPTLLFENLTENMAILELEERCKKAQKESKIIAYAKDHKWQCNRCREQKLWTQYFNSLQGKRDDNDWDNMYRRHIIRPGVLRQCLQCKGEQTKADTFPCTTCQQQLPRQAFSASTWYHRHRSQKIRCFQCTASTGELTFTCAACKKPQSRRIWSIIMETQI